MAKTRATLGLALGVGWLSTHDAPAHEYENGCRVAQVLVQETQNAMSVRGEFQRLLGDCLAFLARSSAPRSQWTRGLESADALVADSLIDAAKLVLGFHSGPDELAAPDFASASEAESFDSLTEHLIQICYAIVGR